MPTSPPGWPAHQHVGLTTRVRSATGLVPCAGRCVVHADRLIPGGHLCPFDGQLHDEVPVRNAAGGAEAACAHSLDTLVPVAFGHVRCVRRRPSVGDAGQAYSVTSAPTAGDPFGAKMSPSSQDPSTGSWSRSAGHANICRGPLFEAATGGVHTGVSCCSKRRAHQDDRRAPAVPPSRAPPRLRSDFATWSRSASCALSTSLDGPCRSLLSTLAAETIDLRDDPRSSSCRRSRYSRSRSGCRSAAHRSSMRPSRQTARATIQVSTNRATMP
jgi:hypothetical protein